MTLGIVRAGKVLLSVCARDGGIPGAFGDAAAMLAGRKEEVAPAPAQMADRELFSQVNARTRLVLTDLEVSEPATGRDGGRA